MLGTAAVPLGIAEGVDLVCGKLAGHAVAFA